MTNKPTTERRICKYVAVWSPYLQEYVKLYDRRPPGVEIDYERARQEGFVSLFLLFKP